VGTAVRLTEFRPVMITKAGKNAVGNDVSEAMLILLVVVLTFIITASVLKRKGRKK
jgi:hypothetical protein